MILGQDFPGLFVWTASAGFAMSSQMTNRIAMKNQTTSPGFGIGLRPTHYQSIIDTQPEIDWFEIISEDFMIKGGNPLQQLDKIRENYPMAMHGVSLSIGSSDPLNKNYLQQLKQLVDRVDPLWVSDHFCWVGVNGLSLHDLMPLPLTEEAVEHVVDHVQQVQDYLGRQILLENVSSYVSYLDSTMTEWEFISEVANRADCLLLLDINNVYVNAFNHNFDPKEFINNVPVGRVRQYHMAGHEHCKTHIIDTHDASIVDSVWELYEVALRRFGNVGTLIERDAAIPSIDDMVSELNQCREICQRIEMTKVTT